jgi:hypothetical protein
MRSNAEVGFEIAPADMDALRDLVERDYSVSSVFAAFSGS